MKKYLVLPILSGLLLVGAVSISYADHRPLEVITECRNATVFGVVSSLNPDDGSLAATTCYAPKGKKSRYKEIVYFDSRDVWVTPYGVECDLPAKVLKHGKTYWKSCRAYNKKGKAVSWMRVIVRPHRPR